MAIFASSSHFSSSSFSPSTFDQKIERLKRKWTNDQKLFSLLTNSNELLSWCWIGEKAMDLAPFVFLLLKCKFCGQFFLQYCRGQELEMLSRVRSGKKNGGIDRPILMLIDQPVFFLRVVRSISVQSSVLAHHTVSLRLDEDHDDADDGDEVGNHDVPERRLLPWSQISFWTESIWGIMFDQIITFLPQNVFFFLLPKFCSSFFPMKELFLYQKNPQYYLKNIFPFLKWSKSLEQYFCLLRHQHLFFCPG